MYLAILSFGTCIKGLGLNTKDGKNTNRRTNQMGWNKCGGAAWNTQRVEQAKRDGTGKRWNKQGMEQAKDGTIK
jgi:hypothetical protein